MDPPADPARPVGAGEDLTAPSSAAGEEAPASASDPAGEPQPTSAARGASPHAPAPASGAPSAPVGSSAAGSRPRAALAYAPGELIVKFRRDVPGSRKRAIRAASNAAFLRNLIVPGLELVKIKKGGERAAAAALQRRPEVVYAEPNYLYRATATTPNDPLFSQLWGLHNRGSAGTADADVDAPEAWDMTTGNASITVAVVDTGVAHDHPDLSSNLWTNPGELGEGKESNGLDDDGNELVDDRRGWDWVNDDGDPYDLNGHGTHVAGTIGARGNDSTGVAGVNWRATLMPLRVLDAGGSGRSSDITEAFAYAAKQGARVVNASLGGPGYSQAQADAIANAPDTLFVIAAGNGGTDGVGDDNDSTPTYPCNYPAANLVCVAASNANDALTSFSNYGATSVHLAAPGSGIVSSVPPARTSVMTDDFELGLANGWTTGGINNSWGLGLDEYGNYLSDSPAGSYLNNTDSWVQRTDPIDLSGKRHCTLDYWGALATEDPHDALLVEASTNGSAWTQIGRWTGGDGRWERRSEELSAFDGEPRVYVRFHFVSNGSTTRDGVQLDDVEVGCSLPYAGNEYARFDGTSMATPHVAGAAALLWAHAPGAPLRAVKQALLEGVDARSALSSKTFSGGRLNAYNSLRLVAPFTADTSPPTGVGIAGSAFDGPFVTTNSFPVALRATDPSGIASYQIRRRQASYGGGFGSYQQSLTTSASFAFTGSPGYTYCFSVAATDAAGNTSGYSGERCTALPLKSAQLSHVGSWSKKTGSGYYLNSYSLSYKKGSELVRTGVAAKRLALLVTKCPGCGTVQLIFNGTSLKTASLASSVTRKKQLVYLTAFGSVRTGTVKIRVASAGKPVRVEGLAVTRL